MGERRFRSCHNRSCDKVTQDRNPCPPSTALHDP